MRRPEVVKALAAAAAEGDRSENAEYTYRKKQLGEIDRRVRYLSKRLQVLRLSICWFSNLGLNELSTLPALVRLNLSGELLDMMRSIRSELAAYEIAETDLSGVTVPTGGCATKAALGAASNVDRWKCEVREALGADAKVKVVTSTAPAVEINVQWAESNMPALDNQGKIQLRTQL